MIIIRYFLPLLCLCLGFPSLTFGELTLLSTESDPDAFIQNCVNVINGDYCESTTDLIIQGPDDLILQRFYSTKNSITGIQEGGWRILPQRFLILGKNPSDQSYSEMSKLYEPTFAYVGERSGGILPYCGWRDSNKTTQHPLVIDILKYGRGMVNTYAGEINGQTNHQNNVLHCSDELCELILGDGTKRIYKHVTYLPSLFLGEELTPMMASQLLEPSYFLLQQEILPSGNQLSFSYNEENRLTSIEMKNSTLSKTLSWMRFAYDFNELGCEVRIDTSDMRTLTYHLILLNGIYQLAKVDGSHFYPLSYEYDGNLVKKVLPEGRFIKINYADGKVASLEGPNAKSGQPEVFCSLTYGKNYTEVYNAAMVKTKYLFDDSFQLTAIERYDDQNHLYRIEQKFWGNTASNAGLLLSKTIGNGLGHISSYRTFQYDASGNITEEKLYGNLSGKEESFLQICPEGKLINPSEKECHVKTFTYSADGFNLLTKIGDCKGSHTRYIYQPGTNLLIKKLISDKDRIRKRTFKLYNEDAVCIKIIEDDGSREEESEIYGYSVTERQIKKIKPKETLPGIGLPEIIEELGLDLTEKRKVLINKFINLYDNQSNLLSCSTYDSQGNYAFTEQRSYNTTGQVTAEVNAAGKKVMYTYDGIGNQISIHTPQENKLIITSYDFQNHPIQITETYPEIQFISQNHFDILGRKTCSIDQFGNATNYEYDAFHRLIKISYPQVLNEEDRLISPTFHYTYDIFGNVSTMEDSNGFTTKTSYNLRGDPTKTEHPDGSTELFNYDMEGSLHRSLNREQMMTIYEYDYLGRITHTQGSVTKKNGISSILFEKWHEYNAFRCISETENNYVKRYYFDPRRRLSSVVEHVKGSSEKSPEARLTEFIYNPLGRVQQKKTWFDSGPKDYALECSEYDLSGNIIEKRIEDSQGSCLLKKQFEYNAQGQCSEEYCIENDVKISSTKTFYNSLGEAVCYLDGFNQETKIFIDYAHQNHLGQTVLKKTLVNPIGVQTEIEFDPLGRVYSILKKDRFGFTLSSQKTLYDSLGNPACDIYDQIVDGKNIGVQKTRRIYGPMGRIDEEIKAVDSPSEKRVTYRYNSLGQTIEKAISGMTPIQYTYDGGKISKIEINDRKKELKVSNTYSYDGRGNIVTASSLHQTVQKTYDLFNQVSRETIKDGLGTYTLRYAYDKKGRIKEITLPDQSKIAYTYDALYGRSVNRISPQGEIQYTHSYTKYDSQGLLLAEKHIGEIGTTKYTYDLNGQKISIKNNFLNEQCARDTLGRIYEVKGRNNGKYEYNGLSQLISEKKLSLKSYAYDSLDNRIKEDNETLLYNTLNQLTGSSRSEFLYDPNGNVLRKVLDGETTKFESNLLSQLISIENADQTGSNFFYDSFGRLLTSKEVENNGKTVLSSSRYFYLGYQEIGCLSPTGNIESLKIPGLEGDQLAKTSIAFELKGKTYVPLPT